MAEFHQIVDVVSWALIGGSLIAFILFEGVRRSRG
jgi:hypothetical protein